LKEDKICYRMVYEL